jgi:formate/nitrite transporter FocA (FNT family)
VTEIPQPEEIYRKTKVEGERRLERPTLEMVSTALAAGFDIVAGVVVLGLVGSQVAPWVGTTSAHVFASLAFGLSFAFLVVGRGELFTENFLVPIAGLDHRRRTAWVGLARLWTTSPVFNVLGGTLVILIVTVHNVLPEGTREPIATAANHIHEQPTLTLFFSAVFAGALMTAMTWFVEGQESMLVRVVIAWAVGAVIALGYFNHVIVTTLELVCGLRLGAPIPVSFIVGNFFLAIAGNMVGGLGLVTLNRLTQGKQGERQRASA